MHDGPRVPLDVFSDPICPWCLIGKRRLEGALAARPDHPFQVRWRVFQLNPEMPPEGMDRRAYLERKFGGPEGAERVYGAIEAQAKADGLPVRFDLIERTPNTINPHRLIRWAEAEDVQDSVVDAIFVRYFQEGADISDPTVLAEIAEEAGMNREMVERLLASDADQDAVRAEDLAARKAGLSAAPTFVVNAKYVVPGAQPSEKWVTVIDELTENLSKLETPSDPPAH